MAFDRNLSAGYLVNHAARLFARALDAGLSPLGISTGPFPLLLHLWDRDGLTQRDLVKLLGYEQPTVAATLSRMERDGLIERRPDPHDGRAQRIWLTAKGRAALDAAEAAAIQVNATALRNLSADEEATFITLLHRVIAGLDPRS